MIRSYYATPIELALLPWTLDFTPDNGGAQAFPLDYLINPYQVAGKPLEWTTRDWDPALRFWTLPYDRHLVEWQRSVNPAAPATLAALEFGGQPQNWQPGRIDPEAAGWFEPRDLDWRLGAADPWGFIRGELEQLKIYMEDDRQRYLLEADVQADGLAAYLVHFIGASTLRHPWTIELVGAGLSIGNIAYMAYKAHHKRVRPSVLRPGLTPPFGPPAHPAFPSGHSFLSHFISLLLLEIPGIFRRFGVLPDHPPGVSGSDGVFLEKPHWDDLTGEEPIPSPLLTIARRIAVNRERIGVHYPSDSLGSRHLAAGLWDAILNDPPQNPNAPKDGAGNVRRIVCPTLRDILSHAAAEWPDPA